MLSESHLTFVSLGVALLVVFNTPPGAARRVKSTLRQALAPYQGLAAAAGRNLRGRDGVRDDAQSAREALDRRRLAELEAENASLRRALELESHTPHRLIACEVISRDDISGWWRMVRVNRGSSSG